MEKYNEYKDSGVQWLGEIPRHWDMLALKHILKIRKKLVGKQSYKYNLLSLTLQGIIKRDMDNPTGKFPSSFDTYQEVNAGDFVFCNFDNEETPRAVGLSEYKGMITGAYDVLSCKNSNLTNKYLIYYFLYIDDAKRFKPLYKGLRKTVPFDSFMSYKIPIPPLSEQQAIADYLDTATAKIDEAIAQQQKMIDLLNEHKQIIINNAVTKGLNPDAPMKDSGVDWIGEIPEHWEVMKLKHIAKLRSGDTISSDSFTEDGFPVYGGNGFRGYTNRFTNDGEYVLIGRQGALCGNVNYAMGKFFASEHAVVVYPYADENTMWLGEVIRASNLNQYSQSAAQPGLAVSVIENIAYPYPPEEERVAIAEYLLQQMNVINAALHNIERQISLLQERKQIIINDVVTGKVKVC